MDPAKLPLTGDGLVEVYRARASSSGGKVSHACAALAQAEHSLSEENFREAFVRSEEALKGVREAKESGALRVAQTYDQNLTSDAAKNLRKEVESDALRLMVKALQGQGSHDQALKTAQYSLSMFRKAGDRLSEAKMLLCVAEVQWPITEDEDVLEEALRAAEMARNICHDLQDSRMEAIALINLAWMYVIRQSDQHDDIAQALAAARSASVLAQQAEHRAGEAQALHVAAAAHAASRAFAECLRSADEALDVYLESKNQRMAAFEWMCMSRWHLDNGDPIRAVADAEEACEAYAAVCSHREPEALMALYKAHAAAKKPSLARRPVKEAICRFEEFGNKTAEGKALDVLFQIHMSIGRDWDALRAGEQAVNIFRDLGERTLESKQLASISSLHYGMGEYEKALQVAERSVPLLRKAGSTAEKVDLMRAVVDTWVALEDKTRAMEEVDEWLQYFKDNDDGEGAGAACMTKSNMLLIDGKIDEAFRAASEAHIAFAEEEDEAGQAEALRVLCEISSKKEEHKMAVRTAEQARHLLKEAGDKLGETTVLYILAQNAVQLAIREGARVEEVPRASKASREALLKASRAVVLAVKQARELPDAAQLLACSLCTLSQVEMLCGRPDEALTAADEGVVLFRDSGDVGSEASALLLSADALRASAEYKDSQEAANEALRLYQEVDDSTGEERAMELLGHLQVHLRPPPAARAPVPMQAPGAPMAQPTSFVTAPQEQAASAPEEGRSIARTAPRSAALDLSRVDEDAIRNKLMEIAIRITGAEDEDIESDTPLMEAGLTSNSAILLRDELAEEMPGVNLPVTLAFDYPSIAAMAELIAESVSKR